MRFSLRASLPSLRRLIHSSWSMDAHMLSHSEKKDVAYLDTIVKKRIQIFERIQAQQKAHREKIGGDPIKITLPDGKVKDGKKWLTSPLDVAVEISKGLAASSLISKVNGILWDMTRPLEGDCLLELFKFDSNEGRDTFWHSSAHILGEGVWNVDWEITLLESLRKRCHFLDHVMKHSHLSNVQVVCGRAETVGQSVDFREKFDVAVARAVAELRILAECSLPLVRVGGLFVAAKGHNPQIEVENAEKAFRLLGSSILHLHSVQSEGPFGLRTAVSCLKHRPTPRKYPRLPGVPAKLPL